MKQHTFTGEDPHEFRQWLEPFLATAKIYRSDDGRVLIVLKHFPPGGNVVDVPYLEDAVFLSDNDGGKLQQLRGAGGSSDGKDHWNCNHPPPGKKLRILASGVVATVLEYPEQGGDFENWEHFDLSADRSVLASMTFVPLPNIRVPEYLFVHQDGRLFYVDAPKYPSGYDYRFRCFVGRPGEMKPVAITNVQRFRDGGTTVIWTDAGVLFSPSLFGQEGKNAKSYFLPLLPPGTLISVIQGGKIPGQTEMRLYGRTDPAAILEQLFPA